MVGVSEGTSFKERVRLGKRDRQGRRTLQEGDCKDYQSRENRRSRDKFTVKESLWKELVC